MGQYNDLLVYFLDILTIHRRLGYNIAQCIYIDSYIYTALNSFRVCDYQKVLAMFDIFRENISILQTLEFDKKLYLYQNDYNVKGSIQNCKLYLNSNQKFNLINQLIYEN
jgi:hypothetical protein